MYGPMQLLPSVPVALAGPLPWFSSFLFCFFFAMGLKNVVVVLGVTANLQGSVPPVLVVIPVGGGWLGVLKLSFLLLFVWPRMSCWQQLAKRVLCFSLTVAFQPMVWLLST